MSTDMESSGSSHHAFPFQLGVFEIKKDGKPEAANGKIAHHLSQVGIRKGSDHFCIHDNLIIDYQVWNEITNQLAFIMDGETPLLRDLMACFVQLDDEGIFVELLIEPRLERVQNIHGRTYNLLTEVCVNHSGLYKINTLSVSIRVIRGFFVSMSLRELILHHQ